MCYLQVWSKLQVLKQNRRNCSMVEILDLSELAALSDKILPKFFFFRKNFPFFSWTTKYAISKFRWKNASFVSRAKFLNCRTTGHFLTNFALFSSFFIFFYFLFFLFFIFLFFYIIFNVFFISLNILPTCFQAKMATLHSSRNS